MDFYAPLNSESVPQLQKIEIASSLQLPSFQIIGLPCPEVAEAKERVRSAIESSGFEFPRRRVVLNLSPASIRKRGTGLDLAMALAILSKDEEFESSLCAWGELGLDGTINPGGQMTRTLYAIWNAEIPYVFISRLELNEARAALRTIAQGEAKRTPAPQLIAVSSLAEAWEIISQRQFKDAAQVEALMTQELHPFQNQVTAYHSLLQLPPFLERVVGVSVSGLHHILLLGPRGVGKTQALDWLIALYPSCEPADLLQQSLLRELSKMESSQSISTLRRVGSSVRASALMGGASAATIRPGEFSLAHGGILLADELPEWSRDSREAFREPLERGKVTLVRAQVGSIELSARFLLAATGNLCPCGGWPVELPLPSKTSVPKCRCSLTARKNYLNRLSGPILDRIDLVVRVAPSVPRGENRTSYTRLLEKVNSTRKRLIELWGKPPGLLTGNELEAIIQQNTTTQKATTTMKSALEGYTFESLRTRHKVTRVALTLAAWDQAPLPSQVHFSEAMQYRSEHLLG
jgi:magnesium chelatase family protein